MTHHILKRWIERTMTVHQHFQSWTSKDWTNQIFESRKKSFVWRKTVTSFDENAKGILHGSHCAPGTHSTVDSRLTNPDLSSWPNLTETMNQTINQIIIITLYNHVYNFYQSKCNLQFWRKSKLNQWVWNLNEHFQKAEPRWTLGFNHKLYYNTYFDHLILEQIFRWKY
jgi:hypothetical protein